MMRRPCLWGAFTLALAATGGHASGLDELDAFVRNVHSGRAEFTQSVTSPSREGQAPRVKTSSGSFEFLRPNRFRFVYRKPYEQTIVADGQTLWWYDTDLNQVTARKQAQALASTPAALIAAAVDLKALQADFVLESAPAREGLEWVRATPRQSESTLQEVRAGFRVQARGPELAVLEILDSFGQRSVLRFGQIVVNQTIAPELFNFKLPPGADLLRP